jgi:elongation factor P
MELMDKLKPFLIDNMLVKLEFYNEEILNIDLPATVILEIEQTEPQLKGATATPSYKPAILSNGVKIMVPPYLETGEKVVVKTEDATYVERAK